MRQVNLNVREVHQTGGDHVVIFKAAIELVPDDPSVRAELVSWDTQPQDEEDARRAVQYICEGIEEVLQPLGWGARIRVYDLYIHPVDFNAWKHKRYAAAYLKSALAEIGL